MPPGIELLAGAGTADNRPGLEHKDLQTIARQIIGADKSVVPRADDDRVEIPLFGHGHDGLRIRSACATLRGHFSATSPDKAASVSETDSRKKIQEFSCVS